MFILFHCNVENGSSNVGQVKRPCILTFQGHQSRAIVEGAVGKVIGSIQLNDNRQEIFDILVDLTITSSNM